MYVHVCVCVWEDTGSDACDRHKLFHFSQCSVEEN